tara:strand:- start:893 stop:1159 length:267 start_codon:yes stop_codon:yes gene_type:complete
MKNIKNLILGFCYLTWGVVNIAIIYAIGKGVLYILERETIGSFLGHLVLGMLFLLALIACSLISLALIADAFGDKKVTKKLDKMWEDE